ncbi:hypothetical protein L0222_21520 [bacterium]|nr:hypothetical protein [bacterium]MCI0604055.1 hypothetical protein [bacterium]
MKSRPTRLLFLLILFLCASVNASPGTGSAELHPIDQSGAQAEILFLDTGDSTTGLIIFGTASGLDPSAGYLSLRYDRLSVPGGPVACEPSPSSTLTFLQMFVGFWSVNPDGTATLFAQLIGASYTELADIGAISIRLASDGSLQACGRIHRNRK